MSSLTKDSLTIIAVLAVLGIIVAVLVGLYNSDPKPYVYTPSPTPEAAFRLECAPAPDSSTVLSYPVMPFSAPQTPQTQQFLCRVASGQLPPPTAP